MAYAVLFYIFTLSVNDMKSLNTYFLTLLSCGMLHAQKFQVTVGDLLTISDAKRFSVVFEYDSELEVKNDSEENYLKIQAEKKEEIEVGTGYVFIQNWYKNRASQYEPSFIQQFNSFNLDGNQLTVAKKTDNSQYTIRIKTTKIMPGYSDLFYVQAGEVKFVIEIYEAANPDIILCGLKTKVRGATVAEEFERIRTAYGNLGLALSKRLNRKALARK